MIEINQKESARVLLKELVNAFKKNELDYLRKNYNETQVRTDFITPLLEIFGWDVYNTAGYPLSSREVIEESTVEIDEERFSKKPDYELRLAKQRKMFVEAKKPSVSIERNKSAVFQARRYGYSASLPIVILTNFYQLSVYDCHPKPNPTDESTIARILFIRYEQFDEYFDELWNILSKYYIQSGAFDRKFSVDVTRKGSEQFDDFFLNQVRIWRKTLALDIYKNNSSLSSEELTYSVQLFLLRIIFLRICEDRNIEKYENLKNISGDSCFNSLMIELRRADEFYDSGLFRLIDDQQLNIRISDKVLSCLINELYYPQSPYTFSVVETEVLGEIYEQFLGEMIIINNLGEVEIISKPEVRESGGVIPTPRYIVDTIVERTLRPLLQGRSPEDLKVFTIADICCGSGVFLLSVFEFMLDYYLQWYISNNIKIHEGHYIYETHKGIWRLTFEEKRRILVSHIRGVDIDNNAVEVARFSLLLKLIESETGSDLRGYVDSTNSPALPELDSIILFGNSLISQTEWRRAFNTFPTDLLNKINPFDWNYEFIEEFKSGGFNAIVGNPPYIRIQNMQHYSPEEVAFYKNAASPYTTAKENNFDKYALFVERSIALVNPKGRLGFIIPNKFMITTAGKALRQLIVQDQMLEEVVDFGVQQVFGKQAINYTCLIILDKKKNKIINFEDVQNLEEWRYSKHGKCKDFTADKITDAPWEFNDSNIDQLFNRVKSQCKNTLSEIAEIFVGLQTSSDAVYIFRAIGETEKTLILQWDNKEWHIEKEMVRPCIHDAKIHCYTNVEANAWIIFPYLMIEGERLKAKLIQPSQMLEEFPLCYNYLISRKEELEKRKISGGCKDEQQFYQFGRSQSLTKFNSPKIVLPVLSLEARYAYDDRNILMTGGGNGPYYSIRSKDNLEETNFFLLAVLHHPLCEVMIKNRASKVRGGYYSHSKQYMEELPIPQTSSKIKMQVANLVEQILETQKSLQIVKIPHQQQKYKRLVNGLIEQAENIISSLFQLDEEDIKLIKTLGKKA